MPEFLTLHNKTIQQEVRTDEEKRGGVGGRFCVGGGERGQSQGEKSWGPEGEREGGRKGEKSGCCVTLSSTSSSRTWPGSPRYRRNAHFLMEQIRRRCNGEGGPQMDAQRTLGSHRTAVNHPGELCVQRLRRRAAARLLGWPRLKSYLAAFSGARAARTAPWRGLVRSLHESQTGEGA